MARAVLTISESELLDALEQSLAKASGPKEARTVKEIQEDTGFSTLKVMTALRALQKQNRLVPCRVARLAVDGVERKVPAYTILPSK